MSTNNEKLRPSRRVALGAAGAWFLSGALPWSASCVRDSPSKSATPPLQRALRTAKASGKPVLAFVDNDDGPQAVGRVVGDMLEIGSVELFAALGMCELVFATQEQIRELFGARTGVEGSGLIDEAEGELRWRPIALDRSYPTYREIERANELRARWNGDSVLDALFADSQISIWAARARAAAHPEHVRSFERRLTASERVDPKELHAWAAIALDHARWRELAPMLAAEVWRSLRERPPLGSRWAQDDGCSAPTLTFFASDGDGVRYDLMRRANGQTPAARDAFGQPIAYAPVDRLLAVCGMAVMTPLSERFLFVYADEP